MQSCSPLIFLNAMFSWNWHLVQLRSHWLPGFIGPVPPPLLIRVFSKLM